MASMLPRTPTTCTTKAATANLTFGKSNFGRIDLTVRRSSEAPEASLETLAFHRLIGETRERSWVHGFTELCMLCLEPPLFQFHE